MKLATKRIFLFFCGSLFFSSLLVTCTEAAQWANKQEAVLDDQTQQADQQVQEFDPKQFFGPEELEPGETIRSSSKPMAAWQIYLESWGVWLAVRFDDAYACIKNITASLRDQMRSRVSALIGLIYAQRVKKEQQ